MRPRSPGALIAEVEAKQQGRDALATTDSSHWIRSIPMAHSSDSADQRAAERHVLALLEALWGVSFVPGTRLSADPSVAPDGVDLDRKVVVEVFARVGQLKAAQKNKVRADLFKLAYLGKLLGPDWRVVFCFVDKDAASFLAGKAWAARAAETFGVEILVQALPDHVRDLVVAAQARQKMVNAKEK